MGQRAKQLARQIESFREELLAFVNNCSESDWNKTLASEEWTIGVTARHLGAGHLAIGDLAAMIVAGKPLPEFTVEKLRELGNAHARKHADCTREEVAEIVRNRSRELADYVSGLSDEELDREAHLSLAGGNVSAQQFIEMVLLQSGGAHFANMKEAAGG